MHSAVVLALQLLLLAPSAWLQTVPDFAGHWRRESGAVLPDEEVITQNASGLTLKATGFPRIVYRFDGVTTRTTYRPSFPQGSTIVRTYRTKIEGGKLVTRIGDQTTVNRRSWIFWRDETRYLSGNGQMVVETLDLTLLPVNGSIGTLDAPVPLTPTPNKVLTTMYVRVTP
jgi:hypothetical protein